MRYKPHTYSMPYRTLCYSFRINPTHTDHAYCFTGPTLTPCRTVLDELQAPH